MYIRDLLYKFTHCCGRVPLARDVEEDPVVAEDGVGDAVAVVIHGAKSAAARDEVGVVLRVTELATLGCLRRRQPPRLAQHLLQKKRRVR